MGPLPQLFTSLLPLLSFTSLLLLPFLFPINLLPPMLSLCTTMLTPCTPGSTPSRMTTPATTLDTRRAEMGPTPREYTTLLFQMADFRPLPTPLMATVDMFLW